MAAGFVVLGTLGAAAVPAQDRPEKTVVLGDPSSQVVLPPELPWSGKSRELALAPGETWATPCEEGGLEITPRYAETVDWLSALADAAPEIEMVSLGTSPEGRTIWMVVASREGVSTPDGLEKTKRPTLLVQAGIHGGEIDGKDAGMMLLRDMTVRGTRTALLDGANLLFIPILNVDGHERFAATNRINQRGPAEMGWRTSSRNLNLNRDYSKLDTPEIRAVVQALREWAPDLYVDVHVTDGIDYEYDITWGYNGPHAHSPNACAWLDTYLTPEVATKLEVWGHVPGPLVLAVDPLDPGQGNTGPTFPVRFSNGYGDARHVASILVENHSLKPYARRVLGTVVFLEGVMEVLGRQGQQLRRAADADRKSRRREVPLDWQASGDTTKVAFKGVRSRVRPSAVSGGLRVEWTGEPVTLQVPLIVEEEPRAAVSRPRAYWIPPAWSDVVDRLRLHGITLDRIDEPKEIEVTMYRILDGGIAAKPYEGRVPPTGTPVAERRRETFPAGSVRVPTDQPLGDLAMLLLEPGSPDSFYRLGFFLEILNPVEYAEGYVMEPLASNMLAGDPALAAEFKKKLATDREFAGDPEARLRWFYERTPFRDERRGLYPVAREEP
jgi:hypothetical protein